MRVSRVANKVLETTLVCLLMASALGNLPGTVNAAKLGADYRRPARTLASPAGQGKIAFTRSVEGRYEIDVINPDGSELMVLSQNGNRPEWSPDGTKIAFVSQREHSQDIYIMNADGTGEVRITYSSDWDWGPLTWSPSGTKIAFGRTPPFFTENPDVWVMNADGSREVQLTTDPSDDWQPSWSPDGTKIAFVSAREGGADIWVMNADGSGQTNLIEDPDWEYHDEDPAWSPDGSIIAFVASREGEIGRSIYFMNADGSNITRLTTSTGDNAHPSWSPDGTRIAFASNRDGNYDIYIMNADGTNETRLTYDTANQSGPSWGIAADTGVIEEEPDIRTPIGSANFGSVVLGSILDKTTTIYNDGSTTLTINSITRTAGSSDFTYISPSTPFSVGVGGSQTITIRFAPSSESPKSATFNINSNDPDEINVTFNVSGSGVARKGTINVTSNPSGASFALSGPANYSGITPWSKTDAPVGIYTITWTPISSYQTPTQESKELTQDGTISFYGPYQSGKGTIEVTSNPSGASFTLSGPANYSGITPWSRADVPIGTYTITWGFKSGYQTPPQEGKTLNQGEAVSFYSQYTAAEAFLGANAATLWEYYSAWGKELPPLSERAKMYEALGLGSAGNYAGTAEQNTRLLNALKERQICPLTAEEVGWVAPVTSVLQYTLSVSSNPLGSITPSPSGESPAGRPLMVISPDTGTVKEYLFYYKAGTTVTLSAEPVAGYEFSHWGDDVAGTKNPGSIMMNSDIRIIAYFIHESVAGGTQVANLEGNELSLLGKAIRETVTQISSLETDNERKKWLSLTQELVRKIESRENVRNVIREKTETQELFVSFAAGLGGVLVQWATYGIVPQYLAAYAFKLAGDMATITAERWLLRDFGAVEVREKGVGTLYAMYDRQQDKVLVHVDLFDYPGGRILIEIPLQPVLVDSPGTGNIVLVKELIPDLQGVWFSYPTVRMLKVEVESPVELMVYDSERHATGITNGEVRNEIPSSTFSEETVIILCLPDSSIDSYQYEVIGIDKGSYSLAVTTTAERTDTFSLANVPTLGSTVHQYTINWDALAKGEKGVTMKIDSDGDGTFEETRELISEGTGFSWVWIIVAAVSGLVGVLVGAFMVWRRTGNKAK